METALASEPQQAVRDLILVLADSKRMLGTRYAEWILGAPELEAGIACASMAQDEWGHGRLLYALLKDFDEDVDRLEHGREPDEYRSMQVLDRSPADWAGLIAINALADLALTVQLEALRSSAHAPLRQRVEKMLEEERFHEAHGVAWFRRLAGTGERARTALREAVADTLPQVLRWFGPDSDRTSALLEAELADAAGSELRARFLQRARPLLDEIDPGLAAVQPGFDEFDESSRRTAGLAPDEATVRRIRGDKNRAFLMD